VVKYGGIGWGRRGSCVDGEGTMYGVDEREDRECV